MLTSDVFQANVILVEGINLCFEIAARQAHQEIDFCLRPLFPVLFREGIESQSRNSDTRRGFDRRTHGGDAGAMSGNAGHVPTPGPTPVSVHDDGDMLGKTHRIEPEVNVRFLAVHPSRNRVSQVELSESKLTHEIQCVQCDRRIGRRWSAGSAPCFSCPELVGWTGETPVTPLITVTQPLLEKSGDSASRCGVSLPKYTGRRLEHRSANDAGHPPRLPASRHLRR